MHFWGISNRFLFALVLVVDLLPSGFGVVDVVGGSIRPRESRIPRMMDPLTYACDRCCAQAHASFGKLVGLGDLLSSCAWVVLCLVMKVSLEEEVPNIGGVIDCEPRTWLSSWPRKMERRGYRECTRCEMPTLGLPSSSSSTTDTLSYPWSTHATTLRGGSLFSEASVHLYS